MCVLKDGVSVTTTPRQTAKILRMEFPMQTWGPTQKCKQNKLKIIKTIKLNFLHVGTKYFYCIFALKYL